MNEFEKINADLKDNVNTNIETHDTNNAFDNNDIGATPICEPTYEANDVNNYESSVHEGQFDEVDSKIKKKNNFGKQAMVAIALGLIFGASSGAAFWGIQAGLGGTKINANGSTNTTIEAAQLVEAPEGEIVSTSISTVAKSVMPSVVSITNLSVQEVQSFFWGTQRYESESTGSGIIIGKNDTELLIVTNNHVVEGNKMLTITFIDDESVEAVVKGTDADIDIAVVAVKMADMSQETLDKIKVATLGDSKALVVGEPTIAIGNALGYGQSVTSGIVSAMDRALDGFDAKLIQTDAAINPGNSGGALLNIKGEVIGINTAKLADNAVEGMGYAIPISDVKEIIEEMMHRVTREKVDEKNKGTLGIMCVSVDETAAKYYNMPVGAYINEVVANSAAEKAGISKGSIITKFDGISINSSTALVDLLAYYAAGETVEVEIAVPNMYGEYEKTVVEITLKSNN